MSARGDAIWLSEDELELLVWLVAGGAMAPATAPTTGLALAALRAKLGAALDEARGGKIG